MKKEYFKDKERLIEIILQIHAGFRDEKDIYKFLEKERRSVESVAKNKKELFDISGQILIDTKMGGRFEIVTTHEMEYIGSDRIPSSLSIKNIESNKTKKIAFAEADYIIMFFEKFACEKKASSGRSDEEVLRENMSMGVKNNYPSGE